MELIWHVSKIAAPSPQTGLFLIYGMALGISSEIGETAHRLRPIIQWMAQELYIAAATKVRNQTLQDGRIQLKKTLLVRVTSDETSPSKNVPKQVALTSLFIASGISSSLNDFPNIISIDYSGLHVASLVKWRSVSKSDPH